MFYNKTLEILHKSIKTLKNMTIAAISTIISLFLFGPFFQLQCAMAAGSCRECSCSLQRR